MSPNNNQVPFKGYAVTNPKAWSDFDVITFKPKNFEDTDVEIAITHCGVCGSDLHTITSGWGDIEPPLIVGHEIIGKATRVGKAVEGIKVGDRVGVGAQIGSCMDCEACKTNNEQYCPKGIDTYNAEYPDGVKTMGGYSTAIRADERFVFPIPEAIESKYAASMLCAGLTVYSPLIRNGCGAGKKVGIVGIGGLGHYAILFAKALAAEVYAFTHSDNKSDEIKKMGADHVVLTDKDGEFAKPLVQKLHLIISTRDVAEDFPIVPYLSMLWVQGRLIQVGLPDHPFPPIPGFAFTSNGSLFGGSKIGSKKEVLDMLKLAVDKSIKPWIEELPMSKAREAVERLKKNDVRYRFVLTQDLL